MGFDMRKTCAMITKRLQSQLEAGKMPPVSALRLTPEQADGLLPLLTDILGKTGRGVFPLPREEHLLFHGLHVLAAARCQGLFRPLLTWLRSPHADIDHILGFGYADEILPGILLAVFDGDAVPLIEAIEDRRVDGCVRWTLFDVLARLVFDGAVGRDAALSLIDRFDRDRLAEDGEEAWEGWQDIIQLLGLEERVDRVRASWRDGRNPQRENDQDDWLDELRRSLAEPSDLSRFEEQRLVPLVDAAEALRAVHDRIDADDPPSSTSIPDKRLPKDPAAKTALTDKEREWLDGFLCSAQAPDMAMDLEEVDGFFTALIVGPELVMPSVYLPVLWGGEGEGPDYDSLEQAEYVTTLLMRHWNTITCRLDQGYPCLPLLAAEEFWPVGRRWSTGFMQGTDLCFIAWERLIEDETDGRMLVPIFALKEALPDGSEPFSEEERVKLLSAVPMLLRNLHAYWRRHGDAGVSSVRKVGRNAPCPCGSGKKYKRCCAAVSATATLH